ncbi:MAG: hypothetical protein IT198_06675 [Acidimicrobiia bacterium]|nr:hypothetical protein [Acidimicrobiia bacterium]
MTEHRLATRPEAGSLGLIPLIDLVSAACDDPSHDVVLTAADWGASYDLDELAEDRERGYPLLRRLTDLLGELDTTRVRMVVAGRCLGPAFALAARLPLEVTPAARLGTSEVRYGIPPLLGLTRHLPARIRGDVAANMLFQGSVMTGHAWTRFDGSGDGTAPAGFRPRPIASALPPATAHVSDELLSATHADLPELELKLLSRALDDPHLAATRRRLHGLMTRDLFAVTYGERIAVYGNGHMGATTAAALASAGLDVVMVGRNPARLEAALEEVHRALDRLERRGPLFCVAQAAAAHVTTTTEPPSDVGGVIEAVAEDVETKLSVLSRARDAAPEAWLATTSSSIERGLLGRDVALLHFAYPTETSPVVEVSFPPAIGQRALDGMRRTLSTMGKAAVEVRSVPGYVVSRILFAYLLEAVELVEAGATPADVDAAANAAGYMFGPLSMLDAASIDLARHVARHVLEPAYGQRFHPPALLDRMVEAGDLGRGTGRGFFVYDGGTPEPNPALAVSLPEETAHDMGARLQLAVVSEAVRLAEECVATVAGIDLLAVGCLRYPVATCGPLAQLAHAGPDLLTFWSSLAESERLSLPTGTEVSP